ncbi:glycosyltransferase [Ornithobacterium rhinotracheale]|uniref:glycosyltransferase family 2 protein n=1 Tax=Ornithobacterium rhinotracheale TaxID=28251 RepID=UPI00129D081E|nr:glycosyltransferase [Ornithobacterium rhinotracheale]MRJ07507.1 glycosyltransferase [Ornithobacterium rhinotracheale]UOH78101.1 glycosyltransferase [Ornithobacterium rhinotracheale]
MKLSIVIPVYNCQDFLNDTFKNLEPLFEKLPKQDFEIVFINDGSTDDSLNVLNEYSTSKPNVFVFSQENKGLSGARNTGIGLAKGEYLQFLDADDYNDFDNVIKLLNFSIDNEIDATSFAIRNVDEHGKDLGGQINHTLEFNRIMSGPDALINGYTPSSMCCLLFRRDFLLEQSLLFTLGLTHQDMEFSMRMFLKAKKVFFSDLIGYNYLQRLGSISKPKTQEKYEKYLFDEVIISNLFKLNKNNSYSKDLNNAIAKNYNSVVWNLIWKLYKSPEKTNARFKEKCFKELTNKKLYPIKGPLKTRFQKFTTFFFNIPIFVKHFIIK